MARGIRGLEESPAYAPESRAVITNPEEASNNPPFLEANLDGTRGALQASDGGPLNRPAPPQHGSFLAQNQCGRAARGSSLVT